MQNVLVLSFVLVLWKKQLKKTCFLIKNFSLSLSSETKLFLMFKIMEVALTCTV